MNILLTGGNGFIGKAVNEMLDDHNVIVTSRSVIKNSSQTYKKNISSTENFADCLIDIDVVIHTAARVHQMNDLSDDPAAEFMETNCFGTLNLAQQDAEAGVKRFIFLSSIKVNGEKSEINKPFRFDDQGNTGDPYGKSKSEAELGLLKISLMTGLEVTIIRPPLVYGPGMKANFPALLKLASKNIPFPLGAVENKRSFIALGNLVSLIVTCIDHPNAVNQVFLASDGYDVSTSRLYTIMTEAYGKKSRLIRINPLLLKIFSSLVGKRSMMDRLCDDLTIDIEHTKNSLEWAPSISMVDGLKLCVQHTINKNKN